jgi:DUF1707 SHOCT-like domain/Cell wall-active antibiotics response LiaF, C-terminal
VDESQLRKPEQPAPARQPAELRASDADRDRAADILREALAEGRLTADEHAERLDLVYAAKTVGELEPVVRDLPGGYTAAAPSAAARGHEYRPGASGENPTLIGILGGGERGGRWRVGSRINAVAIMGGVVIDLTEATFTSSELVINCTVIMGGVEIRVPQNVTLRGGVVGIMGGADVRTNDSDELNAPVVRIQGFALMGGVEAKPKRAKRLKDKGRDKGRGELDR